VREDRTPGGKHRAKKLRVDEPDVSTTMLGPPAMDWNGCEPDELLLSRLVDSRPEAVNSAEGMMDKLGTLLLQTRDLCFLHVWLCVVRQVDVLLKCHDFFVSHSLG